MRTSYFTFGQCHVHVIGGFTYDKDIVLEITAPEPRTIMFNTFGNKWAMEYDSPPTMCLFPRGIKHFPCVVDDDKDNRRVSGSDATSTQERC